MNLSKVIFRQDVVSSNPANIGITLLRVFTGLTLAFSHGIYKMPPSEKFIEGISNMNFPAPELFAWFAACTEFFGGIFLSLGFLTKPASFFIIINMFVAAFIQNGSDPFAKKELALLYLFISLLFLFVGSTKYGIDYFIKKKFTGKK